MKQIILNKDNSSDKYLYEQLYAEIKNAIVSGEMAAGEKCPSIRNLAASLNISVTTVMQAYNQLLAEGYIRNRPGSGYYAEAVLTQNKPAASAKSSPITAAPETTEKASEYIYDEDAFDFNKWKKCAAKIYTEHTKELMYGSDIKGERALRSEIAAYLLRSRGVNTDPERIIIAAGTQQTVFHLARILKKTGINLISVESPGYSPVKSMFADAGFNSADIEVTDSGINIGNLPVNIPSAVYVSPSNQFPTGVVMPIARRYEILEWAVANSSYIIEDDYNSELRYFGKPLPTISSLDESGRVIYLGSFSSTLFSAVRISYMVLPESLAETFDGLASGYSQTCSKAEQLTLAMYMKEGYYYTAIRKKRALYTRKLGVVLETFERFGHEGLSLINTHSGLFFTAKISLSHSVSPENNEIKNKIEDVLDVNQSNKTGDDSEEDKYISVAKELGIYSVYIDELSSDTEKYISVYYSYIPLEKLEGTMIKLIKMWGTLI